MTTTAAPSWPATDNLEQVWAAVEEHGLAPHVAELDVKGFTVVPPELVGPPDVVDRLLDAVLAVGEQRTGVRADVVTGASHAGTRTKDAAGGSATQDWLWHLLFEDLVFEQALLNTTACALVSYLLGDHAKLSVDLAIVKGPSAPSERRGFVHSDAYGVPAPFPAYAQVCNVTWVLTDYTEEAGALGFVPGSHRLQRHPLSLDEGLERWVPAVAERGSLIVWHGNTWHTSHNPRTIPGLRVSWALLFCRQYMAPQQAYHLAVPDGAVERNPARFATFMGLDDPYGVHGTEEDYHRHFRAEVFARSVQGNSQFE